MKISLINALKRRLLADISGVAGSKVQSVICTISIGNQYGMQKSLFIDAYCKSSCAK